MIRVAMDSQILTALQVCEEFFNLRHNHNFQPNTGMGRGIEMGRMMHDMLEAYYGTLREGKGKGDAFANGIAAGQVFITGCEHCMKKVCTVHKRQDTLGLQNTTIDEAHFVIRTFHEYLDFWKNDSWTTINVEHVKSKVIYEDDELSLIWKAKIDWEIDNLEGFFSVDHKTMSRKENPLSLNNQFIGQCVVTEQTKMFRNVIGFQTSLKPADKFLRETINYSKERMNEWILECASYAYDLVDLQKSGRYRHRFTSCSRKYGDCIYRFVCEANPSDRQRVLAEKFIVGKPWDVSND